MHCCCTGSFPFGALSTIVTDSSALSPYAMRRPVLFAPDLASGNFQGCIVPQGETPFSPAFAASPARGGRGAADTVPPRHPLKSRQGFCDSRRSASLQAVLDASQTQLGQQCCLQPSSDVEMDYTPENSSPVSPVRQGRPVSDFRKYKTVYCRYWQKGAKCPYGTQCIYAHGEEELRNETENEVLKLANSLLDAPEEMSCFRLKTRKLSFQPPDRRISHNPTIRSADVRDRSDFACQVRREGQGAAAIPGAWGA
jgi:hypothetical protein